MPRSLILYSAFLLFLCIVSVCSHAQFSNEFGNVSGEELALKKCSFDPEASAAILLEEGDATPGGNNELITYVHRRIKILNDKGLDQANVSITFQSNDNYDDISDLKAQTINVSENGRINVSMVDEKSFYKKKQDKYFSELTFAFPNVRVGSILEYKYRSVKQSFMGLKNWAFQHWMPVYHSSFKLTPAPNLEFTYSVQKNESLPIRIKQASRNSEVISFQMDSVPGLTDEPFMDAREDYLQEVRFTITKYVGTFGNRTYMSSWDEIAKQLWTEQDFGGEVRANIRDAETVVKDATAGLTDMEKMRVVYRTVRSRVSWDGIYSKFAVDGVRTVWNKRSGSSGSINLLLTNLLRTAGLEAYPLLVSERGNGKIDTKIPFHNQFNNVYAAVIVNGKNFYLDATDASASAMVTPTSILNTTALMVRRTKGELVTVEENDIRFQESVLINGKLEPDGKFTAAISKSCKGYSRIENVQHYRTSNKDFADQYITKGMANVSINDLAIKNEDNDTLNFIEEFNLSTVVQQTGDYAFIPLNLFTGLNQNPFTLKGRFSNINFGYRKSIMVNMSMDVPAAWTLDAMPKNIRVMNEDKSILFTRECMFDKESTRVMFRIKVEQSRSQYAVAEYPIIYEFYKKMTDMLNEQIVFKTR